MRRFPSSETSDCNRNIIAPGGSNVSPAEREEKYTKNAVIDPEDNFIARILYGSSIGLTINYLLLIKFTLDYFNYTKPRVSDKFYYENIYLETCWPVVTNLFFFTLPLDIMSCALIVFILFPLSRLSRSTRYYWFLGSTVSGAIFALICYDHSRVPIPIRLLTVTDATRLSMKIASFLIECNKSREVHSKSSMKTLAYFLFIPHLVYKPSYSRSPRIRWLKVLSHVWWLWVGLFPFLSFWVEYFVAIRVDLMTATGDEIYSKCVSIAAGIFMSYSSVIWFFFFENFCGLHGELLRFPHLKTFGDLGEFFRGAKFGAAVNLNVSKWLATYIFIPVQRAGGSRVKAIFYVLCVSMTFHEICVIYILHISAISSSLVVVILGPLLLSLRSHRKLVSIPLALVTASIMCGVYGLGYVLEYLAWNYSSMSDEEKGSKLRLIPLYLTQLTTAQL